MQFLQLMCQPQHGPCPCQLSPAESGKPASCCYLSNLFLANRHTKAAWPVPAIRNRIGESYLENPSVTPYLLRKTGKPTKCPVEILPISHIHSGKTASGTTWVHMESSKGKSVGLISWIMCLDRSWIAHFHWISESNYLDFHWLKGHKNWHKKMPNMTQNDAKQCKIMTLYYTVYQIQILKTWKSCRKSTVQHASLAVKTPSNTCGSSVRSLSRIIRTHEPGPASDGSGNDRNQHQEVRRTTWKFHRSREEAQCDGCYGDGHARQKVVLQDALHLVLLRCGFHAVTRPRKPICQVSLALWTNRSSFLRSSFENKKRPQQKLTQFWPKKCSIKPCGQASNIARRPRGTWAWNSW